MGNEDFNFNDYFKNLKKGKIIINKDFVRWELGNLVLVFYNGNDDYCCLIRTSKHEYELTHIHIEKDKLEGLLHNIDDPCKKISIHKIFFGVFGATFSVVDANDKKKHRYYSI